MSVGTLPASIPLTYVAEVKQSPVVAFSAASLTEAITLLREQWFRDDLREAHSHGAPVWDGKAKLTARRANDDEAAKFSAGMQSADDDGSGDLILVYLVELDQ
jgi:hypothetical protein